MTFIVNPHGRLQEWVADEKGYFVDAGLTDYRLSAHELLTKNAPNRSRGNTRIEDQKTGAYQTYEAGRDASISCACHWTVNMAASDQHGKLWGECYSITPCAIVVPAKSTVQTPQDLAGVEVHVGYQSGSHYTTVQALEAFLSPQQIRLKFGGTPADRVDQMLEGLAPAATVFGPQLYLLEQLGYRKILDCTFMIAAMVPNGADLEDVQRYYNALRAAQSDIDLMHQPYVHYYLNELPQRHATLVDVNRFGPGERLVFEPYTQTLYEATQQWIRERDFFDETLPANNPRSSYQSAVARSGRD